MLYSCPVLSDSGATKNAKGRVQARGITDARKPTRNSPYISRFDLLRRETLIALPYDFLPFSLRSSRGDQTSIDILKAGSSLSLPGEEKDKTL